MSGCRTWAVTRHVVLQEPFPSFLGSLGILLFSNASSWGGGSRETLAHPVSSALLHRGTVATCVLAFTAVVPLARGAP